MEKENQVAVGYSRLTWIIEVRMVHVCDIISGHRVQYKHSLTFHVPHYVVIAMNPIH